MRVKDQCVLLLDRRVSSSRFEVVGHCVNAGARREQPTNLPTQRLQPPPVIPPACTSWLDSGPAPRARQSDVSALPSDHPPLGALNKEEAPLRRHVTWTETRLKME